MAGIQGTTDASLGSVWSDAYTFERVYHKAIRLEEGLVMLVGGQTQSSSGVVATASGIDIVRVVSSSILTNGARQIDYEWETLVGTTTIGRQNFGITRVGDDVYLMNGHSGMVAQPSNAVNRVTFRDSPSLNEVMVLGTTPFRLGGAALVQENDETLGFCGGFTDWNIPSAVAGRYDIVSDSWDTNGGTMKQARIDHEAVVIGGTSDMAGYLMVVGGRVPVTRPAANALDSNYWRFDGTGHDEFGGVGITTGGGASLSSVGKADTCLRLNGGTAASSAGAPQTALNAAMLGSITVEGWITKGTGTVFSCGGSGASSAANNSLLAFGVNPANDKFFIRWQHDSNVVVLNETTALYTDFLKVSDSVSQPTFYHFAITRTPAGDLGLYINAVLIQSWSGLTSPVAGDGTAALFHAGRDSTGTFAAWTGAIDELRISTTARTTSEITQHYDYQKGDVYFDRPIVADRPHIGRCLESCEARDLDNSWAWAGPMAYARFAFGLVNLPDGRLIAIGGLGYRAGDAIEPVPLRSCEIFDPATGLWHQLPDMAYAREFPVVAHDPSRGVVVVAGGAGERAYEVLDLRTMTWKRGISFMASGHYRSAGGLLGDDLVLVAGGAVNASIQPTEAISFILTPGQETVRQGGLNQQVVVDVVDDETFTYQTPDYPGYTVAAGATVTAVGARPSTIPGPFVLDPANGIALTAVQGIVGEELEQGRQYPSLELSTIDEAEPALLFPDAEGYLVFNLGTSEAEYPVKYLGRLTPTALKLDYSYRFQYGVQAGTAVHYLAQRAPFQPQASELVGAFYATDSAAGRSAALEAIDEMVGAGMEVKKRLIYPGDRGLGNEGQPDRLAGKLSDRVAVWAGDDIEGALEQARKGEF